MMAGRLGAEPAILRTVAAFGVDDRTEIETVAPEMAADGVGGPVQFLFLAAGSRSAIGRSICPPRRWFVVLVVEWYS
jgi:hypothetical protein